jgi:hypothetical protein
VLAPLGITTDVAPALTPHFTDVPPSQPLFYEIECASELGVAGGFPDSTFRPTRPVDRQAMAAFLHRIAGAPAFTPTTPTFSDVPADHPFFDEIEWAAAHGIAEGHPDGTYRPTDGVTRQEAAAFFFRLHGEPGYVGPGQATFPDVATDHPFFDEVEWASAQGVVTGRADGTFGPTEALLRQAAAAMACRASLLGP